MGFDIKQQAEIASKEDEGTVVHIFGVDEKPMFYETDDGEEKFPVTITVAGSHSKRYRRAEEIIRKRKLKPSKLTGETIYEDGITKAVACTMDWDGFFNGDAVLEPREQNIALVYQSCPWVYDQVLEAMHDHERFFSKGSTKPSNGSSTSLD